MKLNKKFKIIITSIIFIIVLSISISKLDEILRAKTRLRNIEQYYNENNNIDVIFIGSSIFHYTFFPMEIFNKYGIISYNRSMTQLRSELYYFLAKEAIEKNKPKLFILNSNAKYGIDRLTITHYTNLKNSINKINAFKDMYGYNWIENINSFNLFHSRWKNLDKYDFLTESFYKGRNWGGVELGFEKPPHQALITHIYRCNGKENLEPLDKKILKILNEQ